MNYQLDQSAARKADTRGGFISEIGAYAGRFTRAQAISASTGTKGVGFTFVSDTGQKSDVTLYTIKHDGTELLGLQALMAILTCLSLRGVESKPGKVNRFDPQLGREVVADATIYPDLLEKPIGLLLETREYEKNDGSGIGMAMEIAGVFQPITRFMASEILDRVIKPEKLEKAIAGLRHRPLKPAKGRAPAPASQAATAGAGAFDDMDDDIPF